MDVVALAEFKSASITVCYCECPEQTLVPGYVSCTIAKLINQVC